MAIKRQDKLDLARTSTRVRVGAVVAFTLVALVPSSIAHGDSTAVADSVVRAEEDATPATTGRLVWEAPAPPVGAPSPLRDGPGIPERSTQGEDVQQSPAVGYNVEESVPVAPTDEALQAKPRPSASARPLGTRSTSSGEARVLGGRRSDQAFVSASPRTNHAGKSGLGDVSRTMAALAGVVALILIVAAVVKRVGGGRGGRGGGGWSIAAMLGPAGRAPSGVMRVLARYPAARGQTLVLLQVDRRVLLLAHAHGSARLRGGSGAFTTLAEFTDPEEVASLVLKTGASSDGMSEVRFDSSLVEQAIRYTESDEPVSAAIESTAMRRVRGGQDGDVVELWDEQAVLRPSDDGRAWVSSADTAGPSGHVSLSNSAERAEPTDSMVAIRSRLAGLKGRGVLG